MSFDFSPALWFLCKNCKEPFPNPEELKQHKLETHPGDCLGVKCIIFEEINEPDPQLIFQLSTRTRGSAQSSSASPLPSFKRKAENEVPNCTNANYKKRKICPRKGVHIRKNPYVALQPLTQEEINRATRRTDSNSLHESATELESQSIVNQQSISDGNPTFIDLKPKTEDYSYFNQSVNDQNHNKIQAGLPQPFNDIREVVLQVKDESPPTPPSTTTVEEIVTDPLSQELSVPLTTPPYAPEINLDFDHKFFSPSDGIEGSDDSDSYSETSMEVCMEISPIINQSLKHRNQCKLCRTSLKTVDQAKNHEENCLLHNKDRHIYCLCCEREFKTPMKLKKHLLKHNEPQVIDPDSNLLQDSDDDDDNDDSDEIDDRLPIGQWITKRRKIFGDTIVLEQDQTPTCNLEGRCKIKCKLCIREFSIVDTLKEHLKTCWVYNKRNHRYCIPCQKPFFNRKKLNIHNENLHPFKPLPLPSFYCIECYKEFKTLKELEKHEASAYEFFAAMKEEKRVVRGIRANIRGSETQRKQTLTQNQPQGSFEGPSTSASKMETTTTKKKSCYDATSSMFRIL